MHQAPRHPAPDAGYVRSYYSATAKNLHRRAQLEQDRHADVCIVGGGLTGVSAALHLARRGLDVVLLEAQRLGWGASGRNGGHVGIGQRREPAELEKLVGAGQARRLWDLGLEANALVRQLIDTNAIDCDLKNGILHVAAKAAHVQGLKDYCEFVRHRYRYPSVRFIDREETRSMIGTDRFHASVLETDGAHLHPLNYLLGVATAADAAGATLYEYSKVSRIDYGNKVRVVTRNGSVSARHLVLGCNAYLEKLEHRIAAQIMPINNFVIATEPLDDPLATELIRDDVAVQDTLFVINYWKRSADNRLLFGGGENYTRRFPADIAAFVRKYLLRIYPQLADTRIDYAWGGTLAITMNRMPSFGRIGDNVYYAHGYSGHGVPIATLAGKLLAEAISGETGRFDLMAALPTRRFPGGTLLRWPALVAGMSWYALRDRI